MLCKSIYKDAALTFFPVSAARLSRAGLKVIRLGGSHGVKPGQAHAAVMAQRVALTRKVATLSRQLSDVLCSTGNNPKIVGRV